jgi:hypothetical protein
MPAYKMYGQSHLSVWNKEIDIDTDSIKAMLCTATYVPNQDTHRYKSSVTGESSGTGYTAGGVALTGVSMTYDQATNKFIFTSNPIQWNGLSAVAFRYLVFYDDTPPAATAKPLICYCDFDAETTFTGDLQFSPPADGIFTVVTA